MYFRDSGDGSPVLVLHGAPSSASTLAGLEAALLARGYREFEQAVLAGLALA